jgi:ketosteroid isomerase-like protein
MTTLSKLARDFVTRLESGNLCGAIEQHYADDVVVFENRALARAGRAACVTYEREQLAGQPEPPTYKLRGFAVNEPQGLAFLEYSVRFTSEEGRPLYLELVAVQTWYAGKITQEKFYYEGVVDEGDGG